MEGFNKKELSDILKGFYVNDFKEDFLITNFELDPTRFDDSSSKGNCFISISNARWNEAKRKKTNWVDGNERIMNHYQKCELIITEKPIGQLKDQVMQLVVGDSFAAMRILAEAARKKMKNPVIGITGSVGKSSTRLMLEHLLGGEKTIVASRGNANTQVNVPLYGAKLCKNPDVGIIEISLNALNNQGNLSLVIQPDICIVTAIGEAHLSTLHTKANIAKFKARIFEGMQPGGLAIINKDIKEFDILYNKAKEQTSNIKTYSMTSSEADLYLKKITCSKYTTAVQFHYQGKDYSFEVKMPGHGVVENALCAFLCIAEMGLDLESFLPKIYDFKSLDRVMQLKQFETRDHRKIDLLDDSHNAAIPSMVNAIQTFAEKQVFYKGSKILVLGQVADLGEQSQQLHDKLVPLILDSGADYVFGHGHYMRKVIRQLPSNMVGGWFDHAKDLAKRIPFYCSDDSLILLKGSFSGSDFRLTSGYLQQYLKVSRKQLTSFDSASIADVLQPTWGVSCYNMQTNEEIFAKGDPHSTAIEGLGPVILLYLLYKKGIQNDVVELQRWPTNKGTSIRNKPFKTGERFSLRELLAELKITQHPSATYELANYYYGSSSKALKEIEKEAKSIGLTSCAALNLTGRYRVKEQQAYNLEDLHKLGSRYFSLKNLRTQLPFVNLEEVPIEMNVLFFGNDKKSAICFYKNWMLCMTGLNTYEEMGLLLKSFMKEMLANV